MMSDLAGFAEALREVRRTLFDVMLDCSLYVERKASEGDPEAALIAEDLTAARLFLQIENLRARLALEDGGNVEPTD